MTHLVSEYTWPWANADGYRAIRLEPMGEFARRILGIETPKGAILTPLSGLSLGERMML